MPKYSIRVTRIGIQPDKYKPLSLSSVELDVIRFKRAKVWISAERNGDLSKFLAIVEFRGKVMILTRSEGLCDAFALSEILWNDCERIYGPGFLEFLDASEDGRRCECKVFNPDELVGYFHYIHNTVLKSEWDS